MLRIIYAFFLVSTSSLLTSFIMSGSSRLNKALWTNLTRLKLLTKPDATIKFVLEKSPFNEDDDEEPLPLERDEYCIVGRIYPNSEIYKEGAYRIQLKLTPKYPSEPPEVRFLTPIYHPNVHRDGKNTKKDSFGVRL